MAACCNSTTLTCCECCEGITQETPQTLYNRPELSAIAYRVGTYTQFYQTLLARISQSRQPSLRQLRSREPDDFTIALLDAFSVMGDVLTFYTERLANESYLRTATQRQSVRQLANLVGYRMSPGVAADAYLAFTIDPSAGAFGTVLTATVNAQVMPEQVPMTIIPVGTRVQSIPGPGQTPQTFETVEQINARAEWNAITPLLSQPQQIGGAGANAILLNGSVTNLKNGDWLLPVLASSTPQAPVTVNAVAIAANGLTTEVDLTAPKPLAPPPIYAPSSFFDDPALEASPPVQGSLTTLQAAADIPSAAALLAGSNNWWDAGDIVTAATANQWPLDQLSAIVNQQVALTLAAEGSVFAFRQQAAPFGFNSPNYYSLPPSLRFDSVFEEASSPPASPPTAITIPAAYPASDAWDTSPGANSTGIGLDYWGGKFLYLDSVYSQIIPNSYVVLLAATAGSPFVATVSANTPVTYSNFATTGKVSQLTIKQIGGPAISDFGLRNTIILCQSEALPLAPVPITNTYIGGPASDGVITLGGAYLGLLAGQEIVLSGTTAAQNSAGTYVLGPAAAEVRTLQKVVVTGGNTVITLDSLLDNMYVRSSVTINANVASATNGQTVSETLGNGDGTQQFQSFVLHQAPLTYVLTSALPGTASTLQVWVGGEQWSEVPYFYGHGPGEHIFITSQDDKGVTTITFGDGVTGSRLPTGTANVTATYRFGIGTAGLVNANQLSQMMSRPLGVRGVNNPLPSTGAADPEDLDTGRDQATLNIMTLGRVVSLEDYQDFALAFPGIGKALATWTWDGQKRVVVLTIGGVSGPIPSNDSVLTILPQTIANCSEPGVQLYPFPYQPLNFNLTANVQISPDYEMDAVQSAIITALQQTFGYAARDFGQPVYQSEVIAAIQDIDGVVDVTLTLYQSNDPLQTPQTQIAATVPQSGGQNQIAAAQLLTIDPGTLGVTVTTVTQ